MVAVPGQKGTELAAIDLCVISHAQARLEIVVLLLAQIVMAVAPSIEAASHATRSRPS